LGYLISGVFARHLPDARVLRHALPESMGFELYRHRELDVFAISMFRCTAPPDYPLSASIPTKDLPLELGPHLLALSEAYQRAHRKKQANGIKRSYVNLAESLSAALNQAILVVFTDDDEDDFACVAEIGRLTYLSARCGVEEVYFKDGLVQWRPIEEPVLHKNASDVFANFVDGDPGLAGFGSFDPPDMFGFVRVRCK
jgi:hypothetical protein